MANMNMYMPVKLYTGVNCIEEHKGEIAKLGASCLVVTGKNSARACGALTDVESALIGLGIRYAIFDEIGPNPKLIDCIRASLKAAEIQAQFIIGIGGGSPLDAAKCIAVLAANPGMDQDELYSLNWQTRPLPIIAVGTTAGTGSEVTKVSVITIPDGRKKSFHHEDIFPALAFGDPRYTYHLPEEITISTAIDAFAHSMESYFSRNANEISQNYSVTSIRLLLPSLKKMAAYKDEESAASLTLSAEERESLYHASIYGGLAINITGTCMPHAMGYLLTEQHGIPHGYACAYFLPAFYRHNKKIMKALTQTFLAKIGLPEKELLALLNLILSDIQPEISEEEIAREHSRWIKNGSIAKGWGTITADMCDEILRKNR